jgi:hypothetical protein
MTASAASIVTGEQHRLSELDKILDSKASTKVAADVGGVKRHGMHRELYALVGGVPPLLQSSGGYKNKKASTAQAPASRWSWTKFDNGARKDRLSLSHWVKKGEERSEYAFAKFNKVSRLPRYSRDDYMRYLADDDWSELETTKLIQLCDKFDLRFVVIFDRFNRSGVTAKHRTVEDMKERYYHVFYKIAKARRDDYLRYLTDGEWSKMETTLLFQLQITYDGRFADICAHFNSSGIAKKDRSIDDLKERYYQVWQKITKATGVRQIDLTYRYDAEHEARRKEQLHQLSKRTFAQMHEEVLLNQEVKRIGYRKSDPLRAMAMEDDDGPRWSAEPSPRKRKLSESNKAASGPAKPISIRQNEPTTTHLRSSMVHRTLPLKQKQLLQVGKKCEDLQLAEFPIPTAAVDAAYDACRKVILEHLQIQSSIDHRKYEITQLNLKKRDPASRTRNLRPPP